MSASQLFSLADDTEKEVVEARLSRLGQLLFQIKLGGMPFRVPCHGWRPSLSLTATSRSFLDNREIGDWGRQNKEHDSYHFSSQGILLIWKSAPRFLDTLRCGEPA